MLFVRLKTRLPDGKKQTFCDEFVFLFVLPAITKAATVIGLIVENKRLRQTARCKRYEHSFLSTERAKSFFVYMCNGISCLIESF